MIEIRGLRETLNGARAAIRGVREHTAGLHDDLARLTQTVTGLRQQVNDAHDDLRFEAETLGNSQGSEERLKPSEIGAGEAVLHGAASGLVEGGFREVVAAKAEHLSSMSPGQDGTISGTVTEENHTLLGTSEIGTAFEKPKPLAGFETVTSLANSGRT